MQKETLWKIYTDKNPEFLTDNTTLTEKGLKKFFDQTWESAHKQGLANGKALAKKDSPRNPMDSLFGDRPMGL